MQSWNAVSISRNEEGEEEKETCEKVIHRQREGESREEYEKALKMSDRVGGDLPCTRSRPGPTPSEPSRNSD